MKEKISFLATAIGSLPFDNSNKAIDFLFEKIPSIPNWAQLSKVSVLEDMMVQYNENVAGVEFDSEQNKWVLNNEDDVFYEKLEELFMDYEEIVEGENLELLDKYQISEKYSSTINLFFEKVKENKPQYAKGQVIGPFTYGTGLVDKTGKCVFYDETLKEVIIKALTLKALWQVKKIKEASPETQPIIFMDEPTVSQFGTSAFITVSREELISAMNDIATVLKKFGAMVGVHCCGKTDWSIIMQTEVDIINFDSFFFGESICLYPNELQKFFEKGGLIAWGLVPTLDEEALKNSTAESLIQNFEETKANLIKKGVDEKLILSNSILTPSCGAGCLSEELAEKAFSLLNEISKNLREKYI